MMKETTTAACGGNLERSRNELAVRKKKKSKVETQITRDRAAIQALLKLYSLITTTLHKCRDAAKLTLF